VTLAIYDKIIDQYLMVMIYFRRSTKSTQSIHLIATNIHANAHRARMHGFISFSLLYMFVFDYFFTSQSVQFFTSDY